jgi:hypothetical protein
MVHRSSGSPTLLTTVENYCDMPGKPYMLPRRWSPGDGIAYCITLA